MLFRRVGPSKGSCKQRSQIRNIRTGHFLAILVEMISLFAACPCCGYSLPPIRYFCERCWIELKLQRRGCISSVQEIPIYSLWEWNEDQSLVHTLLKRRKRLNIASAERRLARWTVNALFEEGAARWEGVFYPAKPTQKQDHTWHFAKAVAEQLDVPLIAIDMAITPSYKTLNRRERWLKRANNTAVYSGPQVIKPLLVDDIVTTGATMKALWLALKKPKYALGLSLAYKTFNSGDKI